VVGELAMWQGGPEPELRPLRPTGSIEPSIVRLVSTARGENTGGRGGMGIVRMSRAWRLGLTGRFPLQGRLLMIGFYAGVAFSGLLALLYGRGGRRHDRQT